MPSEQGAKKKQSPEQRIRTLEADLRQNIIRNSNNVIDLIEIINEHGPATSKAVHAVRRAVLLLQGNVSSQTFKAWFAARMRDYGRALLSVLRDPKLSSHHDACVASAALAPRSVFRNLVRATLYPTVGVDDNSDDGGDDEDDGDEESDEQQQEKKGLLPNCVQMIHTSVSRFSDLSNIAFTVLAAKADTVEKEEKDGTTEQGDQDAGENKEKEKDVILSHPIHLRIALLLAASQAPVSSENPAARKVTEVTLKKSRTNGWMAVLQDQRLTMKQRCELVTRLPEDLLPYMSQPLRLADFLTSCYDASAISVSHLPLSLSSLHGLYLLISKHNLDYPRFFHKLYALFSNAIFSFGSDANDNDNASHDAKFRSLAAAFLIKGGTRSLPRNIAAAFIKRLVRRALTAPTPHALWALRLALELLRTYPATAYLVHNPPVNLFDSPTTNTAPAQPPSKKRPRSPSPLADPFDDSQDDPDLSNVENSSLWELEVLSNHFSPAVSRLVILFSTDMRQRPPPLPGFLEDYSSIGFTDLWHAEVKRRAKAMHVAYDKPGTAEKSEQVNKALGSALSWA